MQIPEKVTDEYLMTFDNVPANIAAQYLGITPQAARCFAKMEKIGCKRPDCNRVYISPKKLIAFKHGNDYEERYTAAARVLKQQGLSELCAEIATAILKIIDKKEGEQDAE